MQTVIIFLVFAQHVPVLIFVHGGGWQRGSKDSSFRGAPIIGRVCSQAGLIVATISYRLSPPSILNVSLRTFWVALIAAAIATAFEPFRGRWDLVASARLVVTSLLTVVAAGCFSAACTCSCGARCSYTIGAT